MAEVPVTIGQMIAVAPADRPALLAPDRESMSYAELGRFVERISGQLRANVDGVDSKIAIVVPNGAIAASSFVAVANAAIAAPLNPAYTRDEFAFYLEDLSASLLLCADADGPAAEAARSLDIPVVLVSDADDMRAGEFELDLPAAKALPLDAASPGDVALVLHTSGTTSRPKIVPLSQRNVCASAANVAASLQLSAEDRCVNIMPLFHIHGLIAVILASLRAGAAVYCTPGFNAVRVFGWFADAEPSWYSAVPTMHQAILARAGRNADVVQSMNLRFIRSSSSSLPPQVMREMEGCFDCPVVEAYGMTEAAHQMTSNPVAPGKQKAGAVGLPAGPEVRVLLADGGLADIDQEGEVVIRGPNVTAGYESNEQANRESFVDTADGGGRWFRTGDQGRFDADGYLTITGRLKEIINRGGEKISPREVDEVLMDAPAVAQAVAFAVPHAQLGEDVAAAVVLKDGASASETEIRDFCKQRLAGFKVPRQILVLDEIPKGATGKLQRIGLAQKLGLAEK